jgi:hypothetical protein|tara:strand:- start:44 stop:427 length:384 start_codon:yes stop_codon:yes gene_type:complete
MPGTKRYGYNIGSEIFGPFKRIQKPTRKAVKKTSNIMQEGIGNISKVSKKGFGLTQKTRKKIGKGVKSWFNEAQPQAQPSMSTPYKGMSKGLSRPSFEMPKPKNYQRYIANKGGYISVDPAPKCKPN